MAELILADEWAEPSLVQVYLGDALPDEYYVVGDPVVHGSAVDAIVVAPQGLVAVQAKEWEGEIYPSEQSDWRERRSTGEEVRHPNPNKEASQTSRALNAFLKDEFPALRPTIHHLLVLTKAEARLMESDGTGVPVAGMGRAAEAISGIPASANSSLPDDAVRETLAVALSERRLAVSQRTSEPFVFRSGGILGSGKKVWTVRAAVRHMDKHPDDGIFHLHNDTLAAWLSEQGAGHLAGSAREVMRQPEREPRIALERFLIGTGIVARPRLVVRPRWIDLGCVLSGETSAHQVRVRKGRGRGYLFGTLRSSDPWLRVEPSSLRGEALETVVSADTETLSISRKPWRAEILVESSASEEPTPVPVRVRVVGMPSGLNRYLLRPLAGAAAAGLLGAILGWLLGFSGVPAPSLALGAATAPLAAGAAWAALVGFFWGVLGGMRGLLQPAAWPVSYALGRWMRRTLAWGMLLALLAVVGHWAWRQFGPDPGPSIPEATLRAIVVLGLTLAIVPSVLGEIASAQRAGETARPLTRRALLRRLLLAAISLALVLALVAGVVLLAPVWQQMVAKGRVSAAQEWVGAQWGQLETGIDDYVDQLFLQTYDRRAPLQPTPAPTPSPAMENEVP